jgi:hypothetical protein
MTAFPSYHRATCPSERGLDEVPRGLVVRRMDSFSAAKKTHLCGTPRDAAMLRLRHDPVGEPIAADRRTARSSLHPQLASFDCGFLLSLRIQCKDRGQYRCDVLNRLNVAHPHLAASLAVNVRNLCLHGCCAIVHAAWAGISPLSARLRLLGDLCRNTHFVSPPPGSTSARQGPASSLAPIKCRLFQPSDYFDHIANA